MPSKLTRDPDFPAEIADLMAMFDRCAGGYSTLAVLEASANMLIAAIGAHTRASAGDRAAAMAMAKHLGQNLHGHVAEQWDRQRKPSDVEVRNG